jgi:hypothetical protein
LEENNVDLGFRVHRAIGRNFHAHGDGVVSCEFVSGFCEWFLCVNEFLKGDIKLYINQFKPKPKIQFGWITDQMKMVWLVTKY